MSEYVTVALIKKTRGNKGEVVIDSLTDFPDRFQKEESSFILNIDGVRRNIVLETGWIHKDNWILKFFEYDSIEEAESLVGGELQIPEEELRELPQNSYYLYEIEGLDVLDKTGKHCGAVDSIVRTDGADLMIVTDGERETWVPFISEFVGEINLEKQIIRVKRFEELKEINDK